MNGAGKIPWAVDGVEVELTASFVSAGTRSGPVSIGLFTMLESAKDNIKSSMKLKLVFSYFSKSKPV